MKSEHLKAVPDRQPSLLRWWRRLQQLRRRFFLWWFGRSGGSSSGDSDDSDNNDNTNQPEDKPQAPVTGETKPIQPDKNGNAAVDNSSVQSAIDKAKQDAKKNGTTENGIAVTVPITSAAARPLLT